MCFSRVKNVDSVDLDDVTTLDYRPASDRREWNQRGRLIPVKTARDPKGFHRPDRGQLPLGRVRAAEAQRALDR
jgi:hypothetical protein